jgi:guanylate kinase
MRGNLIIISSPSGGGKGTLIKEVLKTTDRIGYSVSFTTRAIREGEEDGKHYFFITREEFEKLIDSDDLLEYALVHENYYGTSKSRVEKIIAEGSDVILEIDVQGAEIIRRKMPEAIAIFILPPSYEVLKNRLVARQTESEEVLNLRLRNAKGEVERYTEFDYVIINDDKEKATKDLQTAILAERLKLARQREKIREILDTF